MPPEPVTGLKGDIAIPSVRSFEEMFSVADTPDVMLNELLVTESESGVARLGFSERIAVNVSFVPAPVTFRLPSVAKPALVVAEPPPRVPLPVSVRGIVTPDAVKAFPPSLSATAGAGDID